MLLITRAESGQMACGMGSVWGPGKIKSGHNGSGKERKKEEEESRGDEQGKGDFTSTSAACF